MKEEILNSIDYYRLLDYCETHPICLDTQDTIPSKDEICRFLVELNLRYDYLKMTYEPFARELFEAFGAELDMEDVFRETDRAINIHNIYFQRDTVSMMLAKIEYMMREPTPAAQFFFNEIVNFDFRSYWIQDWYELDALQKCYDADPLNFAVNLYDYFDDNDRVIPKPIMLPVAYKKCA